MSLTPEQQQVADVVAKMGFITLPNVNQNFQQPKPIIVEREPEIRPCIEAEKFWS